MRKGPFSVLAVSVLSLLGAGVATAGPLTFEDVFNPNDVLFTRNGPHTLEFTHDLTLEGFDPLTDTLTDATLSVYLRDDNDPSAERSTSHWMICGGSTTKRSRLALGVRC